MNGIRQNNKMVKITSFPRIHITLIGMNNDGYRINGSIGFSITSPKIEIRFVVSDIVEVIDQREIKFSKDEKIRLQNLILSIAINLGFKENFKCIIQSNALPHHGLGSNTAIYMSCIEALFIINNAEYTSADIVYYSKRGGTSGVGINTYFEGGFIFDVGIKNYEQLFIPSSIADRRGNIPLVIHKCKLPNWEIGICIPRYIKNKSEQEEIDFFKSNCPIDRAFVEKILYEAVYGITSSIIENDYDIFCKSINTIQSTQWKYLERSLYGKELIELEHKIKSCGADCVGMSSLGPVLFFVGKNINDIITQINSDIPNATCYSTSLNNEGRIVYYD